MLKNFFIVFILIIIFFVIVITLLYRYTKFTLYYLKEMKFLNNINVIIKNVLWQQNVTEKNRVLWK